MAELGDAPQTRVVRVFLSSTFRDFMQERDLLVKQVFPELRRKARERGVEVAEVDLRWGITEEESRHGKVLPICLAEIQRCRPYFVGMLGERYGWVPPDDEDNRVVLADEEHAWVEEHLGRRSVTELEVLHGVLNNPEMAGRAFFYFRDPAWSQAQTEPGFVCDSKEEAEKLADLKQRILASGFPVVREGDLPNPEALADRIGADLWALIEEQFPELDQPDALEREERKHASYRRSRTELYEDGASGGGKVAQLEQWLAGGEQRILITGESGSGKSALIANWMQRHQQSHPDDVLFAHHLGCSNDANALEPMLARMVQTASKLMADELSEPIKVPQDYWELVSTVTDTLSKLSFWCKQRDRRWIWVLDGLDRLPEENQQALPWLPLQLFPHLHVVISALDCSARTILQDREYTTLTIGPLERDEQKALIATTMRRYNKTLVPELEARILEHEPARSPLFLRVVLDELRVCGRHETLAQQLDDYLKAPSVNALYGKVLERLEADVGREVVEKVMTAIWASRAGLSEPELLAVTKVKPLQWSAIDLGLEGSFGKNSNRLVFDHDHLSDAVKNRYIDTKSGHEAFRSELADKILSAFQEEAIFTEESFIQEFLWQLASARCLRDLHEALFSDFVILAKAVQALGHREVLMHWQLCESLHTQELGELTLSLLDSAIDVLKGNPERLLEYVNATANLIESSGCTIRHLST
jgi:nephrocystin-3